MIVFLPKPLNEGRTTLNEAAAILAVAMVNSNPVLQEQLKGQVAQSPQAGADFILPYFIAIHTALDKRKNQGAF